MTGVPFRWIRSLLRFPEQQRVEHAYQCQTPATPSKNGFSLNGHAANGSGHVNGAAPLSAVRQNL